MLAPTAVIYVAGALAIRGTEAVKAEANRSTLLAGLGMFAAYGLVLAALERGPAAGVAAGGVQRGDRCVGWPRRS